MSLIEKFHGKPQDQDELPAPVLVDNQLEYKIEEIRAHRGTPLKQYLVKWEGYPDHDCTWEDPATVEDTIALDVYEAKPTKPMKRGRRSMKN